LFHSQHWVVTFTKSSSSEHCIEINISPVVAKQFCGVSEDVQKMEGGHCESAFERTGEKGLGEEASSRTLTVF